MKPILLLGAGRMGGALIEGWLRAGAFAPSEIMVRDPAAPAIARVRMDPPDAVLAEAATVVLAVKPQVWREAAEAVAGFLAPEAVVVSICAGVRSADIAGVFRRKVARVMPTTAVAIRQGTASVFAEDGEARKRAHQLFAPLGTVVDLADEGLMHAATAVSGSGPAYLYAFVEALEAAGSSAGLSAKAAAPVTVDRASSLAALALSPAELPAASRASTKA